MQTDVAKAIVAGPCLSAQVRSSKQSGAAKALWKKIQTTGATLFLTAVDVEEAARLRKWLGKLSAGDRANVRLLTPGKFVWSEGEIRLPLGTKRSESGLKDATSAARAALEKAGLEGRVRHNDAEDVVIIADAIDLDATQRKDFWEALAAGPIREAFDPDAPLELQTTAMDLMIAVIAPAPPSETWWHAIVQVELFDPRAVVVLEISGKAETPILNLRKRLRESAALEQARSLSASHMSAALGAAGEGDLTEILDASTLVAARIAAPSKIHFISQWTLANRKYVRRSFWAASKAARSNLKQALKLLKAVDATRYLRVSDLVALYDERDGRQIFDDFSGAVCFAPGEYEFDVGAPSGDVNVDVLVSAIKAYFDKTTDAMPFDRPLLTRRLFSNSLVLLRGEGYYSNLKQTPPWDRAAGYVEEARALSRLCQTLRGSTKGLDAAVAACFSGGDKTRTAWKMLLAMADQARNLGLIVLSAAMHQWRVAGENWDESDLVVSAAALVGLYYRVLVGDQTLIGQDIAKTINKTADAAEQALGRLIEAERAGAKEAEWYDPGRPIRGWREADNPFENFLVGLLAADSNQTKARSTIPLGVYWGGVELPMAAHAAAEVLGTAFKRHGFISIGRYSASAVGDEEFYCDLSTGKFSGLHELLYNTEARVLLLDDNALSGQTLESARDLLLSNGALEIQTWVVRFSGERREGQMRMAGSGIVQPTYLDGMLKGFLGETPYARSYSRKHYESPVGVFNVARSRILRYLHSNGFASIFKREGF